MKRCLGILIALALATACLCAAVAEEKQDEVYWTYAVPMSELYSDYLRLVNRDVPLSEDFEPGDLVKINVKRATTAAVQLRKTASTALEAMFTEALSEGYTLLAKSGYRSYGSQKTIYANRLASNGGEDDGVVNPPGTSEHQTGLACDILNTDYAGRPRMTTDFAQTAEAQWMKDNCAAFGFILRYPDEKTDITKVIFEPWHFRYVGRVAASYIMREGLTLEEFTDEWQLAVLQFTGSGGDIDAQIALEKERELQGPDTRVLELYDEEGEAEISISF